MLYFHGGAYVEEITATHWLFIEQLVHRTGARVIVPIYPLAPLSTAARTVPRLVDLFALLADAGGSRGLVVMGDSAGGGLALAVAQQLRDRHFRLPDRLILISPWLDVEMSHARAREIEPRDPMLAIPGLRDAGMAYAGELQHTDPLVSPLYGDLEGLPPVMCFTGTADLLNPDAVRLAEKLNDPAMINLEVSAGEFHVYPLLPTPAGARARTRIFRALETLAAQSDFAV
ncbi:alpha/beta hydrolase fold domain-containing protein [Microbacterium sp. C23T]